MHNRWARTYDRPCGGKSAQSARSVRYCKLFLSGTVILFLPKPDLIPGAASSLILQRGIVPLSGIDIGVAKHIGHQIDVACLPVQVGAIGAAQLVRGDWF